MLMQLFNLSVPFVAEAFAIPTSKLKLASLAPSLEELPPSSAPEPAERRAFLQFDVPPPPRRKASLRAAALAFAVLGAVFVGMSFWIEAKARLAQVLLQRAWNRTLDGEASVKPWPWADTWPVAKLTIPRLNASVIVLAGASGRTMAFGPGHVDGTAAPGMPGNCVITAHRDTHFAALRDVAQGDVVEIQSPNGRIHRYSVSRTFVAEKSDTWLLRGGEDRLTLITCWPFDAVAPGSPQRWVVEAEPVQNATAAGVSQRHLHSMLQ